MLTHFHNTKLQQWTKWSLCVFPAKAGDTKTHRGSRNASVAAVTVSEWGRLTSDLDPTPVVGHMVPIGPLLCKWVIFPMFSLSYNLNLDDFSPWYVTFDLIKNEGFHVACMTQVWLKSIKACGRYGQITFLNRQQWKKSLLRQRTQKRRVKKGNLAGLLFTKWILFY